MLFVLCCLAIVVCCLCIVLRSCYCNVSFVIAVAPVAPASLHLEVFMYTSVMVLLLSVCAYPGGICLMFLWEAEANTMILLSMRAVV